MDFLLTLLNAESVHSTATIAAIMEYFRDHMEEIENNLEKCNLYLDLFTQIETSCEPLSENQKAVEIYTPIIADKIIKVIVKVEVPDNYLILLRGCLLHNKYVKTDAVKLVFRRIIQLELNVLSPKSRELLLEFCLDIILIIGDDASLLDIYLMPIIESFNESKALILKGMEVLSFLLNYHYTRIQETPLFCNEIIETIHNATNHSSGDVRSFAVDLQLKFLNESKYHLQGGDQKLQRVQQLVPCKIELQICLQYKKTGPDFHSIFLPMEEVVVYAFEISCERNQNTKDCKSWNIIQTFLYWSIHGRKFSQNEISQLQHIFRAAFSAMFTSVCLYGHNDKNISIFFENCISHYTLSAIEWNCESKMSNVQDLIESEIILDSLVDFMALNSIDLVKKVDLGLKFLTITIESALKKKTNVEVWNSHYFKFIVKKMMSFCHGESSCDKLFCCRAISCFLDNIPEERIVTYLPSFVDALLFVVESSSLFFSRAVFFMDLAKKLLFRIVRRFFSPGSSEGFLQKECIDICCKKLVKALSNPCENVRKMVFSLMEKFHILDRPGILEDFCQFPFSSEFFFLEQNNKLLIGMLDGYQLLKTLKHIHCFHNDGIPKLAEKLIKLCHSNMHCIFDTLITGTTLSEKQMLLTTSIQVLTSIYEDVNKKQKLSILQIVTYSLKSNIREVYLNSFHCLQKLELDANDNSVNKTLKSFILSIPGRVPPISDARIINYYMVAFDTRIDEDLRNSLTTSVKKSFEKWSIELKKGSYINYLQIYCKLSNICDWFIDAHRDILPLVISFILQIDNCSKMLYEILLSLIKQHSFLSDIIKQSVKEPKCLPLLEYLFEKYKGAITSKDFKGTVFVENNFTIITKLLFEMLYSPPKMDTVESESSETGSSKTEFNEVKKILSPQQYCSLKIINLINKFEVNSVGKQASLVRKFMQEEVCKENFFHVLNLETDFAHSQEILKAYFNNNVSDIELLFKLFAGATDIFFPSFTSRMSYFIMEMRGPHYKQYLFSLFSKLYSDNICSNVEVCIVKYIISPLYSHLKIFFEQEMYEHIVQSSNVLDVITNYKHNMNSVEVQLLLLQLIYNFVKHVPWYINNSHLETINKELKHPDTTKMLHVFIIFSIESMGSVVVMIKSHGYLLFSLLFRKFGNSLEFLEICPEADDRFLHLFELHKPKLRGNIKEALNNMIQALASREDGFLKLRKLTLQALKNSKTNFFKLALVFRTIIINYDVYFDCKSDFINTMISFMKQLSADDLNKAVLLVDMIDVIIEWHKFSKMKVNKQVRDDDTSKKDGTSNKSMFILRREDRIQLMQCLLQLLFINTNAAKMGPLPISGKEIVEKCLILLEKGFTHEIWPFSSLEIYIIFKEMMKEREIKVYICHKIMQLLCVHLHIENILLRKEEMLAVDDINKIDEYLKIFIEDCLNLSEDCLSSQEVKDATAYIISDIFKLPSGLDCLPSVKELLINFKEDYQNPISLPYARFTVLNCFLIFNPTSLPFSTSVFHRMLNFIINLRRLTTGDATIFNWTT